MFSAYVDKAMHGAAYEQMEDGAFFGTISDFEGLWANGATVEECRQELRASLEDWLILGLWLNDEHIPKLGKLDLVPRKLLRARKGRSESASPSRARKAS